MEQVKEPKVEYIEQDEQILQVTHFDQGDLEELASITSYDKFQVLEWINSNPVAFRKWFVDLTGDLIAGLMLSQIHYWHGYNDRGEPRLEVKKGGFMWLCKADNEWWEEIRISEAQARRAREILEKQSLIIVEIHRFNGIPRVHMRVNKPVFMQNLASLMKKQDESRLVLQHKSDLPHSTNQTCATTQILNRDYTKTTEHICANAQTEPVKVLSEQQQFFGAIATALRIPWQIASNGQSGRIAKLASKVRKLYTLKEVEEADRYWWHDDWRGKKGDAPTDDLLVQTLEKLRKQKEDTDSKWRNA